MVPHNFYNAYRTKIKVYGLKFPTFLNHNKLYLDHKMQKLWIMSKKGENTTFWSLKRKMIETTKILTIQSNVICQNAHHALWNQCRKY